MKTYITFFLILMVSVAQGETIDGFSTDYTSSDAFSEQANIIPWYSFDLAISSDFTVPISFQDIPNSRTGDSFMFDFTAQIQAAATGTDREILRLFDETTEQVYLAIRLNDDSFDVEITNTDGTSFTYALQDKLFEFDNLASRHFHIRIFVSSYFMWFEITPLRTTDGGFDIGDIQDERRFSSTFFGIGPAAVDNFLAKLPGYVAFLGADQAADQIVILAGEIQVNQYSYNNVRNDINRCYARACDDPQLFTIQNTESNGAACLGYTDDVDATSVKSDSCSPDDTELWSFSNGVIQSINWNCLEYVNSASGADVALATCNETDNQKWRYEQGRFVTELNTGFCLDLANNSYVIGTNIQIFNCNNSDAQNWTLVDATNADPGIQTIVNRNGKCLDVSNSSLLSGTNVALFTCNGTSAQQWFVNRNHGTAKTINGFCLDAGAATPAEGTNIHIWECLDVDQQKWRFKDTSIPSIIGLANGLCVDIDGNNSADGTNIQDFGCNGTAAQEWLAQ